MPRHLLSGAARLLGVAAATLALLTLFPAHGFAATTSNSLDLHGFGGWAYGKTDHLLYNVGSPDGKYDNADFALSVAAHPDSRLSLVAQVFFQGGSTGLGDGQDVQLDYAFAEWFVSDAFKVRVGRVKHPFGLYGEVFDVGTVRPFYILPQSIYGLNRFTAKAYNGIGITGNHDLGAGWSVQYDLYGGEIEGDFEVPGKLSNRPADALQPRVDLGFRVEDTIGGRVILSTPIDGLDVGVSAYWGDETIETSVFAPASRSTYLVHGEYLDDRWTIRGEWGSLTTKHQNEEHGKYLEVARKVGPHWELAVRADDWDADLPGRDLRLLPAVFPQFLEHRDYAAGLNYWLSPSFVVRLDVHRVEGNRFALPESAQALAGAVTTGRLDDQTRLVVFGAQFSF